jgi:MoaA/NifB/PqqE/SkfB family radical SAM enzyme
MNQITTQEIKNYIDELYLIIEKKKGHILNFAGGEPLLRKDMLEIISYASKLGFYTNIATNGWLITKSYAEKLVKSGLSSVVFSIDGFKKVHDLMRGRKGSFEKAMKAIENIAYFRDLIQSERILEDRITISIQTVLCKLNMHEVVAMVDWIDHNTLGIKTIHFNAVSEPNNTKHDKNWYKNAFKELWPDNKDEVNKVVDQIYKLKLNGSKIAEAPKQILAYKRYFNEPQKFIKAGPCNFDKSLTLSSTGDMFLCFNYESIGNIRETKLTQAWKSYSSEEVRNKIRGCQKNCHFLINCYYEE